MPLSAWSIWRLLRAQMARCTLIHAPAWTKFMDILFSSKVEQFGKHLELNFCPSFELFGWTSSMNSISKSYWPWGLFLMDSHWHQHLLETISKQPVGDRTLIFCTIDDFAHSTPPPPTVSGLQLVPHTAACSICYNSSQTQPYLSPLCNYCFAATLTTTDITVHIEQHPVSRCWLILVSLNMNAGTCRLPSYRCLV